MFQCFSQFSVCGLGRDFFLWHWESLLQRKKGWQPDRRTHTGCLLGLVCVCCHSNRQPVMAEAWRWWRWRLLQLFSNCEGGCREFVDGAQKYQRGSIWWICSDSGWPQHFTHNAFLNGDFLITDQMWVKFNPQQPLCRKMCYSCTKTMFVYSGSLREQSKNVVFIFIFYVTVKRSKGSR